MSKQIRLGEVEIELKHQGKQFLGLGRIKVGAVVVRSGELPMRPFTATHDGIEFDRFEIESIQQTSRRVVIRTRAIGVSGRVWPLLDHSLDPVWDTRRWDGQPIAEARMDWIIETASKEIAGRRYDGLAYSFRFRSKKNDIYYIMDRATWELGGVAKGVTLLRQQSGGDPKVTVGARTSSSTSAVIGFPLNPVMTHDLPRWASEQGFDYQYKGSDALIGLFDHCGLIRTIVTHKAGDNHIRHFDKHIFDQTPDAATIRKFIGVSRGVGDDVDHTNAWTAVFDADGDNVLGEFGMHRTYPRTTLSHNFWNNFDCNSYRKDLLPAAAALGFQQVFIDPYWQNDMTAGRQGLLPKGIQGNMCCPWQYEVADVLGGIKGYQKLAEDARATGVDIVSWIGSHQSILSPYLREHRAQVIKHADARHMWGSGYDEIYGMDLTTAFGDMFEECVLRNTKATGIAGYLYDSFYNFAWMPTNYFTPDPANPNDQNKGTLKAHTQWRRLCQIMAAWQKAGVHMLIESLGPWGQPQHGVQGAYNKPGCEPLAYQCSVNIGYSIIPTGATAKGVQPGPEFYYRLLANKAPSTQGLWVRQEGKEALRLDQAASPIIRQGNLDYRAVLPLMHTRTVLHGDAGVLWAPAKGARQVLFSYKNRPLDLPAGTEYLDQTTGQRGAASAAGLAAEAFHTYVIG